MNNSIPTIEFQGLAPVVVTSSLAVATVLTNVFLLFVLIFRVKKKQFSSFLFTSLGLSDLMVGSFVMPIEIIKMSGFSTCFKNGAGYLIGFIVTYSQSSVTLYILLTLSIQRLCLVVLPHTTSEKMTRPKTVALIAIWILLYGLTSAYILLWFFVGISESSGLSPSIPVSHKLVINTLYYFVPNIFLAPINVAIIVSLKRGAPKMPAKLSNKGSTLAYVKKNNKSNRDAKAIRCLCMIVVTSFFSQIFYLCLGSVRLYEYPINPTVFTVAVWMSFLNSLINPFILFIFHDMVQAACCKIIS